MKIAGITAIVPPMMAACQPNSTSVGIMITPVIGTSPVGFR